MVQNFGYLKPFFDQPTLILIYYLTYFNDFMAKNILCLDTLNP